MGVCHPSDWLRDRAAALVRTVPQRRRRAVQDVADPARSGGDGGCLPQRRVCGGGDGDAVIAGGVFERVGQYVACMGGAAGEGADSPLICQTGRSGARIS